MRVVQINVACQYGSTGVIVVEIAEYLKQHGHEVYIAYGQGMTDYPDSYRIGTPLENRLHGILNTRIWGEEGTGTIRGTKRFIDWLNQIKPDIIHIHNLHSNYLNYKLFFPYLAKKKIPVVWTFMDCWPFTGKCSHFTEIKCEKWKKECHHCPQLRSSGPISWFFDKTQKLYHEKQQWFKMLQYLDIIAISEWQKEEVLKSMACHHPVHMIYLWIDTKKFYEIHDKYVYKRYGLSPQKKILLSVSAQWSNQTTRLNDAIRLAKILPEDYQLVIVGKKTTKQILPVNLIHIDYIAGSEELSKLYSCALAYVNFSVEDTFGKVMAESQLCGTPAIVFDSTACSEVAGDAGYAVPPHDVEAMLERVLEIEHNGREYYSQRCIEHVKKNFDYNVNVGKYLEIYQHALIRKQTKTAHNTQL